MKQIAVNQTDVAKQLGCLESTQLDFLCLALFAGYCLTEIRELMIT